MIRIFLIASLASLLLNCPSEAAANDNFSNSVSKIYAPYVQPLENELEYELVYQDDNQAKFADQQRHSVGYGQSLNDSWFVEARISGSNSPQYDFDISGYELEAKYQITEQGEFGSDWGILFELERESNKQIWEFGGTLIVLHNWNRWTGTANFTLAYEAGPQLDDELETELAAQLKYRNRPGFEPGFEYYKSESTNAAGPSADGRIRLGGGKNVFWSAAALFSFDRSKPDQILRLSIEYEF